MRTVIDNAVAPAGVFTQNNVETYVAQQATSVRGADGNAVVIAHTFTQVMQTAHVTGLPFPNVVEKLRALYNVMCDEVGENSDGTAISTLHSESHCNPATGNDGRSKTLRYEERDKRIYDLACDIEEYPWWDDVVDTINREFSEYHIDKAAAQDAAKRYAERYELPKYPRRKPGRRSEK